MRAADNLRIAFSLASVLILSGVGSGQAHGEGKFSVSETPPPKASPPVNNGNAQRPALPDCRYSNSDPRCRPSHRPINPYHRSQPVIIEQTPATPAIDLNALTDDWDGCREAKLGAIDARNTGSADQANRLDEWLWKNCRSYSNELRQLEQNDM